MAASSAIVFGKYRLVAELGQGGMAQVYLALASGPVGFNKLVVLKLIREQFGDDPEFLSMFLDEARLAARLNHPNVVQTNEVGELDGRYFICMEYLEGQPLNRILARIGAAHTARPEAERLTVGMELRIVIDSLAGLHSAHELADFDGTPLSVVHRDVSPHNLFVTYAGGVKVVDFGIAKAMSSSLETRTGVLKGKIGYMAPEQSRGEHVDRRADVFAAGMVLWEMLAGKRMHKGLPDIAILQRLMKGDLPSPRTEAPWVSLRLEAVCMRALAFDKNDRYATAAEFAAELEAVLDETDRGSLRDAGRLVERAFDSDRIRIKAIVESQISGVKMASDGGFDPLMTGSMQRLPVLDQPTDLPSGPTGVGLSAAKSFSRVNQAPSVQSPDEQRLVSQSSSLTANTTAGDFSPRAAVSTKALVLGATLAVALGGVLAVAFFVGHLSARGAPPASVGSASQETASPPPANHVLRIESTPSGARVMEGVALLGTTPLTLPLPKEGPPRKLAVSLDGYLPYALEQGAATEDVRLVVPLAPAPSASAAEPAATARAPGDGPHAKTPHAVPPVVTRPPATAQPAGTLDIHMER